MNAIIFICTTWIYIEAEYGLGDLGIGVSIPGRRNKFTFLRRIKTSSGAHLVSYLEDTGKYSSGGKAAGV
jgi:hypothetical protein